MEEVIEKLFLFLSFELSEEPHLLCQGQKSGDSLRKMKEIQDRTINNSTKNKRLRGSRKTTVELQSNQIKLGL